MLYLNLAIIGMTEGAVYALLGLGLILIYRSTGVLNFSQAAMAMCSAYVAWQITTSAPWLTVWGALAITIAFGALMGAGLYYLIFSRLRDSPPVARLIASVGVAFILPALVRVVWSGQSERGLHLPFQFGSGVVKFSSIALQVQKLGLIAVTVGCGIGLHQWMKRSVTGTALRAVAQNRMAAQMAGVPERRISAAAWAIGGAMAALAGALYVPLAYLDPNMMIPFLPKAFAAALLGGLVNLPMGLVGGLALGAVESVFRGMHGSLPRLAETVGALGIVAFLLIRIERFFVSEHELKAIEQ
ncbi:MAG: branched-chain amino acid ABC transporter permease [Actinomycetota bacterium]